MSILTAAPFHDEAAAFEMVESIVWPNGPICPHCGNALVVRDWHNILNYRIGDSGACLECGGAIAGRFQKFTKPFGSRRMPVSLMKMGSESNFPARTILSR